jgi:hypothetical protein
VPPPFPRPPTFLQPSALGCVFPSHAPSIQAAAPQPTLPRGRSVCAGGWGGELHTCRSGERHGGEPLGRAGEGRGGGALEHDVAAVHLEVVRRDVPAAAPRRTNRSGAVRCHGGCACSGGTSAGQAAAAGDGGCASTTQQSTPTADVNPRPWLGRQRPQVHLSTARPGQAQHLAARRRHRALHPVEGAGAPGLCDQKCHQAMLAVRRRWLRAAVRAAAKRLRTGDSR